MTSFMSLSRFPAAPQWNVAVSPKASRTSNRGEAEQL
ncbi:hypothetical protein H4W33_003945 [Kibdelosporangium phytohabitans]|nr:hypothetical protein [Kibdelosporangium phytohabitans]